jgi:dopamine beta-monooxygenase
MKIFRPLSIFASSLVLLQDVNAQSIDNVTEYFGGDDNEAYLEWYDEINASYQGSVYIPSANPKNGAAIHWAVVSVPEDGTAIAGEYIQIAVAARATGWLGFGIAEAGGMLGADMALFTAIRPDELVDAYTMEAKVPMTDDCQQDWKLIASHVDERGFLMFEARRLLDTGDPQDKVIINDQSTLVPAHRVIAAWGDTTEVGYHGLSNARGAIRFFGSGDDDALFRETMAVEAEGTFEVRASNHTIKSIDTDYVRFCFSREDLIAQGVPDTDDLLNVIGFEPIITEGNEAFLHHFVVYASSNPSCSEDLNEIAYLWAPGEGPYSHPINLGTPLFGSDGFRAFEVDIHYNNPQGIAGEIDSSGMRFFYTSKAREFQIGVLELGDPSLALFGEPVGDGLTLHEFACPASCSSLAISEPVQVIREFLHMHKTGVRVTNEQIRDNVVVRTGAIDLWEFDQAGAAAPRQQPFMVNPGDGFKTSCYYRDNDQSVFGRSSQSEMCIAYLFYYPRVTLELFGETYPWMCGQDIGFATCSTTYTETSLVDDSDLQRGFGVNQCDATETETETPAVAPTPAPYGSSGSSIRDFASFVTIALMVFNSISSF